MAKPYSLDLRERGVAAVESGQSIRAVGKVFGVSASTASKWTKRKRETGSPAAKQVDGYCPLLLAPERQWLLERVAASRTSLPGNLLPSCRKEVLRPAIWRSGKS